MLFFGLVFWLFVRRSVDWQCPNEGGKPFGLLLCQIDREFDRQAEIGTQMKAVQQDVLVIIDWFLLRRASRTGSHAEII